MGKYLGKAFCRCYIAFFVHDGDDQMQAVDNILISVEQTCNSMYAYSAEYLQETPLRTKFKDLSRFGTELAIDTALMEACMPVLKFTGSELRKINSLKALREASLAARAMQATRTTIAGGAAWCRNTVDSVKQIARGAYEIATNPGLVTAGEYGVGMSKADKARAMLTLLRESTLAGSASPSRLVTTCIEGIHAAGLEAKMLCECLEAYFETMEFVCEGQKVKVLPNEQFCKHVADLLAKYDPKGNIIKLLGGHANKDILIANEIMTAVGLARYENITHLPFGCIDAKVFVGNEWKWCSMFNPHNSLKRHFTDIGEAIQDGLSKISYAQFKDRTFTLSGNAKNGTPIIIHVLDGELNSAYPNVQQLKVLLKQQKQKI